MNQFTNPNQRGPDLPQGCRDLIDVVQKPWLMQVSTPSELQTKFAPDYQVGTADRVEFHLSRLFTSMRGHRTLCVGCAEPRAFVCLLNQLGEISISLLATSGQAGIVRALFRESEILPIFDSFTKSVGQSSGLLRFPLPKSVAKAAVLITQLLGRCFGISQEKEVCFYHHQTIAA